MKYFNEKEINEEFNKLETRDKIKVLYEAIDFMQEYNGRSKFLCIAMAMGYVNYDGCSDSYYKRAEQEGNGMRKIKEKNAN